jgi:hypothetical protein
VDSVYESVGVWEYSHTPTLPNSNTQTEEQC